MGVIPVYELAFYITPMGVEPLARFTVQEIANKFITIAGLETMTPSVDGNVEEWNPLEAHGWVRRMMTGKSLTLAMAGKRQEGTAGNDMIAELATETGASVKRTALIVFPNKDQLAFDAVINVGQSFGGDAVNVSGIDFAVMSTGKPLYSVFGADSVTATKVWDDAAFAGARPAVWFKLMRKVGAGALEEVPGAHVKPVPRIADSDSWPVVWDNVMQKNSLGQNYTFSVQEVDDDGAEFTPLGYTKDESGLTVTNTLVGP